MSLVLYYAEHSPPSQTVRIFADAVGIDFELRRVDLMKKEHLSAEYLKLNPQHTIPVLVDGDLVIWESRVIIAYLANKYAKNSPLYPQDSKKRAVVDQRLQFDQGTLDGRLEKAYCHYLFFGGTTVEQSDVNKVAEALKWLDVFLGKTKYVAGDELTLADFSTVVTVSFLHLALGWDLTAFPNVARWYQQVQKEIKAWPKIVEPHMKGLEGFCAAMKKDLGMIKQLNKKALEIM